MALGLLCLILTLLETVKTEKLNFHLTDTQASPLTWTPASPLSKVFLQPNFQEDKLQGRWYSLAMADERRQNATKKKLSMHSITLKLIGNHSFLVTTSKVRLPKPLLSEHLIYVLPTPGCKQWNRTLYATDQLGHFILPDISGPPGIQRNSMKVVDTDYSQYAIMAFTQETNTFLMLYGRTKELSPALQEWFVHFAKHLGFTDDSIAFHVHTGHCIDESTGAAAAFPVS